MSKKGTILIVDDNRNVLSALKILLTGCFENIIILAHPKHLKSTIKENNVDVVLLDMNFSSGVNSGNEGIFWLSEIKADFPTGIEVVLMTAFADIDRAIKGIKYGAFDFVAKPWNNDKLVTTLKSAYETATATKQKKRSSNVNSTTENRGMYWGESSKMQQIKALVEKVAKTDANILIIGENGTGKEVMAREIHHLSLRNSHEMVSVDMGSITESLFESEMFGHVRGAFTDAKNDRAGKFEEANNSTIFLDEIGNIPLHTQAKLLTILQTRKIVRVGSNSPIDINVRLVSATNQNIEHMVDRGDFRMDLMYRLNTIIIQIPPLRERTEDIAPLAMKFIESYSIKYGKKAMKLSPQAEKKLENHSWRGNIRELQHMVEKAVILCSGSTIDVELFELSDFGSNQSTTTKPATATNNILTIEEMERQMIMDAIQLHESNLSAVALILGITRQTLYNKMKKYNI